MTDAFDDGYRKDDDPLKPLNLKQTPKRSTAVALKAGAPGAMVPRIAAAGRGALAERILQLAFEHGIRVREDSDLAEMLAVVELDSPIPTEAFAAVAEILAYVYRANGAPNPFDAVLRDEAQQGDITQHGGESGHDDQ